MKGQLAQAGCGTGSQREMGAGGCHWGWRRRIRGQKWRDPEQRGGGGEQESEASGPKRGLGLGSPKAMGVGRQGGLEESGDWSDWGLQERKGLPGPGAPNAYLQPGGDSEWKVERENISARSAIFSGERPPARRGRGRASAPRPSSLPPRSSALPSSPRDTPCDTPPADTPRHPAGHRGSERDAAGGGEEGRRIREGGDKGGDRERRGHAGKLVGGEKMV